MCYLADDNSLGPSPTTPGNVATYLTQLSQVGASQNVNIVFWAKTTQPIFTGTTGAVIGHVDPTQTYPNNLIVDQDLGTGVSDADPAQLVNFVTWAVGPTGSFRANHYILAVNDHGGDLLGFAQDANTSPSGPMSYTQLKAALCKRRTESA
jgi:hypothetical protein